MLNSNLPTESEISSFLPQIKKFLIEECEFETRPFYVIRNLTILIARNMSAKDNPKLANEYTAVTGSKKKGDSLRVMLTKFLNENYEIIKAAACKYHTCTLRKDFKGVKNFIDEISLMFFSE
ncbi:hypothetical protein [Pumilibacter intestinalis]|uniref:hypothetical protein n=1 Tax=Pumilibacter intestinalis TaxID=2941511 RepID=UPI00203E99AC|nr:hypothetical protein [Pumilibacter intestinalis]